MNEEQDAPRGSALVGCAFQLYLLISQLFALWWYLAGIVEIAQTGNMVELGLWVLFIGPIICEIQAVFWPLLICLGS